MYPFLTLAQVASSLHQTTSPQQINSVIGCIIDIQRPVYRQKQNNYIIEIKVIDESFNQSVENSSLINYLSVCLISTKKQDLEFCHKVGGFIYLQKFNYYSWNSIKLSTIYRGVCQSVFNIQSGQIEDQDFKIIKRLGVQEPIMDISDFALRISQLKMWLRQNFFNVFNPFLGVKIINNYCALIQPFSIILKVDQQVKNEYQRYLYLTDQSQNTFFIDLKDFKLLHFKQKEWIFLRGIKFIDNTYQIILNQSGNILKLPQLFTDQYQKKANYQAIYRKTSKIGTQRKQDAKLTYITISDQKPTSVKQLFEIQDKYLGTSKKEEVLLQNNFLVKGVVVKYSGRFKIYHTQYQMIVHDKYLQSITTQEKKETIHQRKLTYIYEGTLYVMDRSIISKRQILKIKLFTNDSKSMFFDLKEIQYLNEYIGNSDQKQIVQQAQRKMNEKFQKLLQLSTFENPASFVLEPVKSDQLIFRLINTKII